MLKFLGEDEPRPDSKFVPAPAKKGFLFFYRKNCIISTSLLGACVVIHGLVWHKSEANQSDKPRHAYTFHVFDQGTAKWNPDAW